MSNAGNGADRRARPAVGPLGLLLIVVIAGFGLYLLIRLLVDWLQPPPPCKDGLFDVHGECVGVTDNADRFKRDPDHFPEGLSEVSERIREQNARAEQGLHATIALEIPMTSPYERRQREILHQVQGAYLAQYRANQESGQIAGPPKIRLVFANIGEDRKSWDVVHPKLAELAKSGEDNLRVAFGFDLSVQETRDALADLTTKHRIPAVLGPSTADSVSNARTGEPEFPGLARVAPTNSEQAAALVNFDRELRVEKRLSLEKAVLVADTVEGDDYVASLREAFRALLRKSPHPEKTYKSTGSDADGVLGGEFRRFANNICAADPEIDTIYFAGRVVQLQQFISALGERDCPTRRFTLVSGSGASTLYDAKGLDWDAIKGDPERGRKGINVRYTSNAHKDAWTAKGAPKTGGSAADVEALVQLADPRTRPDAVGRIGEVDLIDSRMYVVHDAALTAIKGIRERMADEDLIDGKELPTADQIRDDWDRLQGQTMVRGASGWICLDSSGNPYDKAVVVVELDPSDGKVAQQARRTRFLGLAWPTGQPPNVDKAKGCQPTAD
ncbi:ABC transporter substrate-binding protein [Streptomyces monticola]|uniref:ABC transporter substrate-binding protein n=1 Tax=Streptomyces monticola TaxID=2666263 RepID=A0ABW2JU46_9ACTN